MEWIVYIIILSLCAGTFIMARSARAHARLALRESQKAVAAKDEAETALVAILDDDGNVRGRLALPGRIPEPPPPPPTTTPCGDLCEHAFFVEDLTEPLPNGGWAGTWNCQANRGRGCDISRPKFLNKETNNCVMFERDDD